MLAPLGQIVQLAMAKVAEKCGWNVGNRRHDWPRHGFKDSTGWESNQMDNSAISRAFASTLTPFHCQTQGQPRTYAELPFGLE